MNKLIAKATLFCLLALLGLVFLFWDTNPLRANVNANLLAQAKKTRAVRPTKTPTQEHNVPPMIYPETNAEEIPETTDPNELASPLAETFAFYQNLSGIKVSSPYGVVVTPKGQVLMVDGKNKRVCVFDLFDHYVAPCFGKGQLTGPYGIAVDRSNGDIYITDYDGNKIFKYDANFNLLKSWGKAGTGKGKFKGPAGIWAANGKVYVSDSGNSRVQVFDTNGKFVSKFGSAGTGSGQFYYPYGLTADASGNVYVSDTSNNRIQKFDASFKFVKAWGKKGSSNRQFNLPRMLSIDERGWIYVADQGNNRIQVFDGNGKFKSKFGVKGAGTGQMNKPSGVAVNTNTDSVYVSDTGNNRAQHWVHGSGAAKLTVNKVLSPSDDAGKFNLRIGSQTCATDVGNGGTTGSVGLSPGTYSVSETAGTGTDLGNYVTVFTGDCAADGSITLNAGENKVCSIVNMHQGTSCMETITAPFTSGIYAVTTQLSYAGIVSATVSGVGQASGAEWSDAFYVYTDSAGNPVTPTHPGGWMLCINGADAGDFVNPLPSYNSSHIYTFQINAPGGKLTFGVCDAYSADNTGSYTIGVGCQAPTVMPIATPTNGATQ